MLRVTFPREAIRPAKIIVAGHPHASNASGRAPQKSYAHVDRSKNLAGLPTTRRGRGQHDTPRCHAPRQLNASRFAGRFACDRTIGLAATHDRVNSESPGRVPVSQGGRLVAGDGSQSAPLSCRASTPARVGASALHGFVIRVRRACGEVPRGLLRCGPVAAGHVVQRRPPSCFACLRHLCACFLRFVILRSVSPRAPPRRALPRPPVDVAFSFAFFLRLRCTERRVGFDSGSFSLMSSIYHGSR